MSDYEKKLREKYPVDNILFSKINSLEEGRAILATLDRWSAEIITEMRSIELDNEKSESWHNVMYDIKTARSNIQSQMAVFVKRKRKNNHLS